MTFLRAGGLVLTLTAADWPGGQSLKAGWGDNFLYQNPHFIESRWRPRLATGKGRRRAVTPLMCLPAGQPWHGRDGWGEGLEAGAAETEWEAGQRQGESPRLEGRKTESGT